MFRFPRSAFNGAAESERVSESRGGGGGGGKMMSSEVKYCGGSWRRGGRDELVRSSYDWQIGNLKLES